MQVKRFVAADMRRALDLVRQEMGSEAVILSSHRTPQGVELVTSLDADLPTRGVDERRAFGRAFEEDIDTPLPSDSAWRAHAGVQQAVSEYGAKPSSHKLAKTSEQLAAEIEQARERMLAAKRQAKLSEQPLKDSLSHSSTAEEPKEAQSLTREERKPTVKATSSQRDIVDDDANELQCLRDELADMRLLLEQQLWQLTQPITDHNVLPAGFNTQGIPRDHIKIKTQQHLQRLGLAQDIVQSLISEIGAEQRLSQAWREALARLSRQIPVSGVDISEAGGVFALVGATGVGKTTTIAKLAARYVLQHGPGKVALVTTDTYRVGAQDQLRSFGRILNIPVRSVDQQASLVTVLANLKSFPLILIDTAGFRHGDPMLQQQLAMLNEVSAVQKVLVLAANSQVQTLKASVHAHLSKDLRSCVLTKLDETVSLGEALSVILEQGIPLSYITDGQEVPKDIHIAVAHKLVARLVAVAKSGMSSERPVSSEILQDDVV